MYGDVGESDEYFGIKLEIRNQWLYHGADDKAPLMVVTVTSTVTGIME